MGLPSDHRGSTVHYLLKLPISFPSHSPCLTLPSLSVCLSVSLSLPASLFFMSLSESVRLHLCQRISHSRFGLFFFISPFCLSGSSGSLSLSSSPAVIYLSCLSVCSWLCLAFSPSVCCAHWDFATVAAWFFSPPGPIFLSLPLFMPNNGLHLVSFLESSGCAFPFANTNPYLLVVCCWILFWTECRFYWSYNKQL